MQRGQPLGCFLHPPMPVLPPWWCPTHHVPHCSLARSPFPAPQGKQFSVIVTEGRPDETGLTMARVLEEMRVPTTVILDCAVAYAMER